MPLHFEKGVPHFWGSWSVISKETLFISNSIHRVWKEECMITSLNMCILILDGWSVDVSLQKQTCACGLQVTCKWPLWHLAFSPQNQPTFIYHKVHCLFCNIFYDIKQLQFFFACDTIIKRKKMFQACQHVIFDILYGFRWLNKMFFLFILWLAKGNL